MSLSPQSIDNQGFTLEVWMYPLNITSSSDSLLFSVTNYTDVDLTNNGTSLRLDLYGTDGYIDQAVVFQNYRFRLLYWTLYTI